MLPLPLPLPRARGAASLVLLAMLLSPGLALATPTTKGGADYAKECRDAGVPSPPDWGSISWIDKGPQSVLLDPPNPVARVYLYKSYEPQGICVAIPRTGDPTFTTIMSMGIICQGHTGKVCFWDSISTETFSANTATPIVGGTKFRGGKDLAVGHPVCTDCHTGENPFIVHPGTAVDLRDSKGVSILNSGTWPDPLVPASWPQNPPPATGFGPCTSCHRRPTAYEPKLAGRIPEVSRDQSGYCSIVLNRMLERNIMPPPPHDQNSFLGDIALLRLKCTNPPPTGPVVRPVEISEAFKGRFVFGDQDNNIYAVTKNGELLFYKHSGAADGSSHWNIGGNVVGAPLFNWAKYKKVFTGGRGVIYGINADNQLVWHKHLGQVAGTPDWAPGSGTVVGPNWSFNQIFATTNGDGIIYAVSPSTGRLHWYKHTGFNTGANTWAPGTGNAVGGPGWDGLSRLMAGPDGVIYGVNSDNNLVWFRHTGYATGTGYWASNTGAVVGWSWTASTMFTGSQGRIYTIGADLNLNWYRHAGYLDGTVNWVDNYARLVGTWWEFMPLPYFD